MSDDNCELCSGSGEVVITPYGMHDKHAANYGCPMCIQADRDKAEQQRDELLAALKSLVDQHDAVFAGRDDGAKDSYYNAHPGRAIAYRNARAAIAKAEG